MWENTQTLWSYPMAALGTQRAFESAVRAAAFWKANFTKQTVGYTLIGAAKFMCPQQTNNMIPGTCISLETDKFPVLPGEDSEVVNEGMYGKALCIYLQSELPSFGITVEHYCAEDWGWWLGVIENDFKLGLGIYSHNPIGQSPQAYAIHSLITNRKKWYWRQFKSVDVTINVTSIFDKIENALGFDSEIWSVERHDGFPY